MGKYENNRSNSYNANRASGCSCNANRGRDNKYANRSSKACCGNEYASRSYDDCCEKEYANRSSKACCENEYANRSSDPCCENGYAERAFGGKDNSWYSSADSYVWRGAGRADGCDDDCGRESCPAVLHLHEVQGSVQVASDGCEAHNHRFATVTCEPVILRDGRHAHKLTFRTDAYEGHCHEFSGMTTGEYEICGCHVHYLEGETSRQAGHCHEFRVITHIENPTED